MTAADHKTPTKIEDLLPGDHLCWLYDTEEEHRIFVTRFLSDGLARHEKVVYLYDTHPPETIRGYLNAAGLDVEALLNRGQLVLASAESLYFQGDRFDPGDTLKALLVERGRALADGFAALRVTGETGWVCSGIPALNQVLDYEAQVSHIMPQSDILALCQYNRHHFDPALLLKVLMTHPYVAVGTEILDNFYFAPCTDEMDRGRADERLTHWLGNLQTRQRESQALSESRDKLRSFIDHASEGVVITDEEGRVIEWNQAQSEISGVPASAAQGRLIWEVQGEMAFPPLNLEQREQVKQQVQGFLQKSKENWPRMPATTRIKGSGDSERLIQSMVFPIATKRGKIFGSLTRDVTRDFSSQAALQRRADEFKALFETAQDIAVESDPHRVLRLILEHACALLEAPEGGIFLYDGIHGEFELVQSMNPDFTGRKIPADAGLIGQVARTRKPVIENSYRTFGGRVAEAIPNLESVLQAPLLYGGELYGVIALSVPYGNPRRFDEADARLLSVLATLAAGAIHHTRLYHETSERAERLGLLYDAGLALNRELEPDKQLDTLLRISMRALHADRAQFFRFIPRLNRMEYSRSLGAGEELHEKLRNLSFDLDDQETVDARIVQGRKPYYAPDVRKELGWKTIDPRVRSAIWVPVLHNEQLSGLLCLSSQRENGFREQDLTMLDLFANQVAVALENARLYAEERRYASVLSEITRLGGELAGMQTERELLTHLVKRTSEITRSETCTFLRVDHAAGEGVLEAGVGLPKDTPSGLRVPLALPMLRALLAQHKPLIVADIDREAPGLRSLMVRPDVCAFQAYPMVYQGQALGYITLSYLESVVPSLQEISSFELLAERSAAALENVRLKQETAQNLRELQALHTIDKTISSSLDLKFTLNVVLEQAMGQLQMDAADILLVQPHLLSLEYAVGRGFRVRSDRKRVRVGEGHAGRVALDRRGLYTTHLHAESENGRGGALYPGEEFIAYYGQPLVSKGRVKGVLEAFYRKPFEPDSRWINQIEMLATEAAIAIENVELFDGLQRSNLDLTLAYDQTIEGWSRALDQLEGTPEGHGRQLASLVVLLGHEIGVSDADSVQLRRGALLHDIGRMGLPEAVLSKPGPLTSEEMDLVRKHPVRGYELLAPIEFLRPARDIPYSHHEHWDGSGYPRGLKGIEIPLAARIFAIVDVWDALRSPRPYRGPWDENRVRQYLKEQAGILFDPEIVPVFIRLLEEFPLSSLGSF